MNPRANSTNRSAPTATSSGNNSAGPRRRTRSMSRTRGEAFLFPAVGGPSAAKRPRLSRRSATDEVCSLERVLIRQVHRGDTWYYVKWVLRKADRSLVPSFTWQRERDLDSYQQQLDEFNETCEEKGEPGFFVPGEEARLTDDEVPLPDSRRQRARARALENARQLKEAQENARRMREELERQENLRRINETRERQQVVRMGNIFANCVIS